MEKFIQLNLKNILTGIKTKEDTMLLPCMI